MPNPFKVPPDYILHFADVLERWLDDGRRAGSITPTNPLTVTQMQEIPSLCAALGENRLDRLVVCKAVRSKRRAMIPIASNQRGYFMARKPDELDDTIETIMNKIVSLHGLVDELQSCRSKLEVDRMQRHTPVYHLAE